MQTAPQSLPVPEVHIETPQLMSGLGPPDMLLMSDDSDKKLPSSNSTPGTLAEPSTSTSVATTPPGTSVDRTSTDLPRTMETDASKPVSDGHISTGITQPASESPATADGQDVVKDDVIPVETGATVVGTTDAVGAVQTDNETLTKDLEQKEINASTDTAVTTGPANTQQVSEGGSASPTESQEVS